MGSRLCFRCWLLAALRIPLQATVVTGGWAAAPFPPTGRLLPLRLIAAYCFRFSVGRTSPSGGEGWQRGSRRTFRRRPTPPDAAVRSGGRHGGLGVPLSNFPMLSVVLGDRVRARQGRVARTGYSRAPRGGSISIRAVGTDDGGGTGDDDDGRAYGEVRGGRERMGGGGRMGGMNRRLTCVPRKR